MSRLRPTDVLVRDRVAQLVDLPDGRLLVRHRRGLSLLAGTGRAEVMRLLGRIDGRRTAAEVAGSPADAALLDALAGEVVQVRGAIDQTGEPGEPAEPEEPSPPEAPGALTGEVAGLPVVALEGVSYRRLLEIQDAHRRRGEAVLFVTADPDGLRIGPRVPPDGSAACLGCSLLAALAPAGLPAAETLAAASSLHTVALADLFPAAELRRRLGARVAREAAAPERSVDGVVLLRPDGTETALPVPRRGDCPACGGARRTASVETAGWTGAGARPRRPVHVGILGGGTAGCLTALAIRARHPECRVTLIHAPDVPVIGVGEATTPLMPQFLHADLGISAQELFREVRPTLKLGIRFDWGAEETGGFPYPFGPVRTLEAATWDGDLDACSPWAVLMAAGVVPVRRLPADRDGGLAAAFGTEVAYHLDNRRLAAFLERLAGVRGVERIEARVVGVERTAAGDRPEIVSLVGEGGRRFLFDLYVDCSGFRSLLMGGASDGGLGSPFVGYDASLFTDRAVVGAIPRPPEAPVPPFTRARTRAAGWSWSIPQPESDHVGSVYASAFATAEEAARELREGSDAEVEGLRELRFRPGRRRHFVRGNVVALGNAYGFVEPLESTALHLLIRQIGLLVRHLPEVASGIGGRGGEEREATAERLNREVAAFWDYVGWFLAIHFRFNRRLDTPFWRACRAEADVSAHGELLERFRADGPLAYQDGPAGFDYPDPLWGPEGIDTILLGQGVPCRMPEPPVPEAAWRQERRRMERFAAACLPQGELLASLPEHPEVLDRFESAFRDRGRAF